MHSCLMAQILPLPAQAFVYVIGALDGPQKIGVAAEPTRRLAMLKVGNPADLVVSSCLAFSRDLAFEAERYAHWLLRDQRLGGEWFDVSPADAADALEAARAAVSAGKRIPRAGQVKREALGLLRQPWQRRAKDAGLTQVTLARLLGRPVNTISRQIRGENGGVPQHLVAVIVAWEIMAPEQREEWMTATQKACGVS